MTSEKRLSRVDRKRLASIVRKAFRGEKIDGSALAWVGEIDAFELVSMRDNISHAAFHRVITKSTASPLFPGDNSVPTRADLLHSIGEWFALTLKDEIGEDEADNELEELRTLVHFQV